MTRDEMLKLPCIYLGAPRGAGVMLGLTTEIHGTHPIERGALVAVYQEPHPYGGIQKHYTDAWRGLSNAAQAKGYKGLLYVPDALALVQSRGHLGAVRVEACRRAGDQFVITLADPVRLPEKEAA